MTEPRPTNLSRLLQNRRFLSLFFFLWGLLGTLSPVSHAEEKKGKPGEVEAVADQLEYERQGKKIICKGNVVVTYGEVKLTSDYAEIETETKKAYARGHVVVLRGEQLSAKGEEVYYDFENDQGSFPNGQAVSWPWFTQGEEVRQVGKGKLRLKNATVTSCDRGRPHYKIMAKSATVRTGDKIVCRNVTLSVLGKKVFWWPYVVIPLQDLPESPVQIQPGYSSQYGAYILTSKSFSIMKPLFGKWHIDWRAKRGFGAGADFNYHFEGIKTDGSVQTYLTKDTNAPNPLLKNPYSERDDRTRGRLTWKHRTDFNPHTHAQLRFHRVADEFFLQDFFQKEFRSDVQPASFVTFTHNSDRYGSYIFNQVRINEFEDVTERLPEIRFDWKNAPITPLFKDRLYYESVSSLANLNQENGRSAPDDHAFRFDTLHQLASPFKWKEFKLTPLAHIRETLYSRDFDEADGRARTSFGAGADLRTHFYRTFNVTSDFLGVDINQLRHVFEPSVRYDGTFHSNVSSEELFQFDSVDAVDDSHRVTFGLENRIQTKRVFKGRMRRVDLVSLNTFLSHDFHPDQEYSRSGFSTLNGDLQLRPYEWLQFEIRYEYDMIRDKFREFNQDMLARKGRFHFLFGNRYVAKREFLNVDANNQFVFDGGYWLNDKWKVGAHLRWDQEKHELQEWQISATRDLHDFLLDFGYNVRNSDIDESNKELFFLFTLKVFPQYPLKSGNRASFAEPRIGATVAGSNQASGASGIEA